MRRRPRGCRESARPTDAAALRRVPPRLRALSAVTDGHARAGLASRTTFQLQRDKGLPKQLLPFMRVCYCESAEELQSIDMTGEAPIDASCSDIVRHLVLSLQQRLARYDNTMQSDAAALEDAALPARQRVALQLLLCEKRILNDALSSLMHVECAPLTSDLSRFDTEFLRSLSSKVQLT